MKFEQQLEQMDLAELTEKALAAMDAASRRVSDWLTKVRPADGAAGRFLWAIETTRPSNVASTANLLSGLTKMGIFDELITPDDRTEGVEWIRQMQRDDGNFYDPALMDRKTPGWPDDKPWPEPAMRLGVSQYAFSVLSALSSSPVDTPPPPSPKEWPGPEDADKALDWVKTRPWQTNPWGAGSHSMRMARYLLDWHQQGKIPLDPLIAVLRWFYQVQNPQTGLWGSPDTPLFQRINGTFKLFPLIRDALDLPLPHADRIIDQILSEYYRSDYDHTVGGCDEGNNWYVIDLACEKAPGHRADEISKLAAYRIARMLELFTQRDGGLSYYPDRCQGTWIGYDMAPEIAQGDAMGPATIAGAVNFCIYILGLADRTGWTGKLRMSERVPEDLRAQIEARVFDR